MTTSFLPRATACTLTYNLSRTPDSGQTPTCTLYAPNGSVLQASTAVASMVRTTINGSSTAGASSLTLSSGTGIVAGDRYWAGPNTSGQTEQVTCHGISSVTLTTRQPLLYSYAATHVLASRKATLSVLAGSIPTAYANCRAVWSYVSGSVTYTETSLFHISSFAPVCTVTEADILRRLPLARNTVDPYQPLSELITDVWESNILVDLSVVWSPETMILGEALRVATIDRVMAEVCLASDKLELYDKFVEAYRTSMERVVSSSPVDTDSDSDTTDEQKYSNRVVRLVRG